MTSRPTGWLVGIAVLTLLGACSPEPLDFRSDAENLLEDELATDPGGAWTATCAEPTSVEIDATFACTVTDADGVVRNFTAVITSRSKYTIAEDPAPAG